MKFGEKYKTVKLTTFELAEFPRYDGRVGEGYFRSANTVDGSPMVMTWVDDPLEGARDIWYHVEIEDAQLEIPRAFHSCRCGLEFPGPNGGFEFVHHRCTVAA